MACRLYHCPSKNEIRLYFILDLKSKSMPYQVFSFLETTYTSSAESYRRLHSQSASVRKALKSRNRSV